MKHTKYLYFIAPYNNKADNNNIFFGKMIKVHKLLTRQDTEPF